MILFYSALKCGVLIEPHAVMMAVAVVRAEAMATTTTSPPSPAAAGQLYIVIIIQWAYNSKELPFNWLHFSFSLSLPCSFSLIRFCFGFDLLAISEVIFLIACFPPLSSLDSWFLILVIVIIIYSFDNIIGKMSVNNRKLYLSCLFFAILLLSLINSAFVEIRHFDRYSHLNISVYTFSFWLVRSYLFGARVFIIITRKDSCETPEISHDEKLNLFITYFFSASLCLPLTHTSVDHGGS